MAKTINIKTRFQNKHDIPANWEKATFIPLAGELIIYDDHYFDADGNKVVVADTIRYKVGDGVTPINDLPFANNEITKTTVTTALGYTPPTLNEVQAYIDETILGGEW